MLLIWGHVPAALKTQLTHPFFKKPDLDPALLKNIPPISSLPFLANVLGKAVASQLLNNKF